MESSWTKRVLLLLLLVFIFFTGIICDDTKIVPPPPPSTNNTVPINKNISIPNSDSAGPNKNVNTIITDPVEEKQPEVVAKPSQSFNGNSVPGGFFIFSTLGFIVIVIIVYKVYSGRFSRAERRYGVQGQQGTQELTPLPLAIEDDDSENDDQTLFDIHQQLHARDNFVL